MSTIFDDVEVTLVDVLETAFPEATVSVKKPSPDVSPYPSKIITVRSDGAATGTRDITRVEMIGVNVWADSYKDASDLAREVDSVIRATRNGSIKLVESNMSPVRVDNAGPQEQRYMTFRVTMKSKDV